MPSSGQGRGLVFFGVKLDEANGTANHLKLVDPKFKAVRGFTGGAGLSGIVFQDSESN